MAEPAIMLLQSEFARTACRRRTEADLEMLRENVERACGLEGAWNDKATAHAELHCLIADATGVPAYSLLARLIGESMRDMIAGAGPRAEGPLIDSHRRLIRCLEDRDADGAVQEMDRCLAQLLTVTAET